MEAYRVLNKTTSRNAYNARIFTKKPEPNYPPYNYDYERTRRYTARENYRYRLIIIIIY